MLVIRLRRIGRKGDPHYRIVVAEHTAPIQGKFIAEIGHHHPKSKETVIQNDQFLAWLEQGATPSNTVAKLAEKSGIAHARIVIKQFHGKPKKGTSDIKSVPSEQLGEDTSTPPEATAPEGDEKPEISDESDSEAGPDQSEAKA